LREIVYQSLGNHAHLWVHVHAGADLEAVAAERLDFEAVVVGDHGGVAAPEFLVLAAVEVRFEKFALEVPVRASDAEEEDVGFEEVHDAEAVEVLLAVGEGVREHDFDVGGVLGGGDDAGLGGVLAEGKPVLVEVDLVDEAAEVEERHFEFVHAEDEGGHARLFHSGRHVHALRLVFVHLLEPFCVRELPLAHLHDLEVLPHHQHPRFSSISRLQRFHFWVVFLGLYLLLQEEEGLLGLLHSAQVHVLQDLL